MFATIPSTVLAEINTLARAIINRGTNLPAITAVLLTVHPDTPRRLTATATDLDITATRTFDLHEPAVPGTLLVPAADLARIRPDKATTITLLQRTPHTATITATTNKSPTSFPVELLPTKDFPPAPPDPAPGTYGRAILPPATLAAIAASVPFHSRDETRHVLQGAFLTSGELCATDGRRAAVFRAKGTPVPVILPTKLCQLIARLKPTVAVATQPHGKDQIILTLGSDVHIHSRTVSGNFPNYRQVIPDHPPGTPSITFADPKPVIDHLRRLKEVPGHSNSVTLTRLSDHLLELRHPSATITTPAAFQHGHLPPVAYNPRFLADNLEAAGPTLTTTSAMDPALFNTHAVLAVLMPMRVTSTTKPKAPAEAETPATA